MLRLPCVRTALLERARGQILAIPHSQDMGGTLALALALARNGQQPAALPVDPLFFSSSPCLKCPCAPCIQLRRCCTTHSAFSSRFATTANCERTPRARRINTATGLQWPGRTPASNWCACGIWAGGLWLALGDILKLDRSCHIGHGSWRLARPVRRTPRQEHRQGRLTSPPAGGGHGLWGLGVGVGSCVAGSYMGVLVGHRGPVPGPQHVSIRRQITSAVWK